MLRVGLTGGIACGKSHVLRRLAALGCRTLDLDAVAREVTAPGGEALGEIAGAFGSGVIDARGALDRPALGALVFSDAAARARLNGIVHPRVRAAEALWAAGFAGEAGAVLVTDGALLIESGVHLRFDRLAVVHCAPELQLQRLRERDGLDEAAARARIESQLSSAAKREFAHFEIDSSGAPADTERATDALAALLAGLATSARPRGRALEAFVGGLLHGPREGPRGLSPALLLAQAAEAAGLELDVLARKLAPPARGPWYRAGEEQAPAGVAAGRLGVALAAWGECRSGADPEFVAAAAASVARLTHADSASRADACLAALVALQRATASPQAADVGALVARGHAPAVRFGGGAPSGRLDGVWAALQRFPREPAAASALAASLGSDGPTAAALAGIGLDAVGAEAEGWRAALAAVS